MAVSRVQSNQVSTGGATGTSIAVSLNGILAQSLVACAVMCDNTSATISGVADDLSVAAVKSVGLSDTNHSERQEHWYFKNYGGGNRTFTATFSVSTAWRALLAVETSGADLASPLGPTNSNSAATGATITAGSVTATQDGAYFFASCQGNTQPAAQSPLSEIWADTTLVHSHADNAQSTAAAFNATWTHTSGAWSAIVSTFYPAVAAPTRAARAMAPQQRMC